MKQSQQKHLLNLSQKIKDSSPLLSGVNQSFEHQQGISFSDHIFPEEQFSSLESLLANQNRKEFLCAKMLKPSELQKFIRVYQCYTCSIENNSIICIDCFQEQKHTNHHYEILEVDGGCCDCGDDSKWVEKGFCSKHTFNEKIVKNIDPKVKEKVKEEFTRICNIAFQVLCQLYSDFRKKLKKFKQEKSQRGIEEEKDLLLLKQKADNYGHCFLAKLIELNKGRYNVNCICRDWLSTEFFQSKKRPRFITEKVIRGQMMKFYQLNKTAQACVQLYLILFYRNPHFKQNVATHYFSFYHSFSEYACSNYKEFSPQIFSSSKLISKLIKAQAIKPLFISPGINEYQNVPLLEKEIQKFSELFKSYYNDTQYFLAFRPDLCQIYWNCFLQFCQKEGFSNFISYYDTLSEKQNYLSLVNKHIYQIEQLAMTVFIKIVEKMMEFPKFQFVEKGLKKQFNAIFIEKISQNVNCFPSNLFFSHYRIFAILLFAFCAKQQNSDIFGQKLLANVASLADWLKVDQNYLKKCFYSLIQLFLAYFFKISKVMNSQQSLQLNLNFATTYFKSSNPNFLFSLDSFLFKFALTSFLLINENQKQEGVICKLINNYLSQFDNQFRDSITSYKQSTNAQQKQQAFLRIKECVFSLHSFINLVKESIRSDLPQLILLSRLKPLLNIESNKNRFIYFYQKILKLMIPKQKGVSLVDLRRLIRYLFFKEDTIFEEFILKFIDTENKEYLSQKNVKSEKVSLQYFYSLRFKLSNSKVNELIDSIPFSDFPYGTDPQKGNSIFSKTKYLQIVSSWIKECIQIKQCRQNIINDLARQLWKMKLLQKDQNIHYYFNQTFSRLRVNQQEEEENNSYSLSVYSFLDKELCSELKSAIQKHAYSNDDDNNNDASYFKQLKNKEKQCEGQIIQEDQLQNMPPEIQKKENIIEYQRVCMFGQQCKASNGNKQLYWGCFVKQTNMHSLLTIKQSERILTFSACRHFVHRKCFSELKEENQPFAKCKKCKKYINLLLIEYDILQRLDISTRSVQSYFFSEQWPITRQDRSRGLEIFKSLTLFLVSSLVVDDFGCFRNNLLFYRVLFKNLKQTPCQLKFGINEQILINSSSVSKQSCIFAFASSRLARQLWNKQITEEKNAQRLLNSDFASCINSILRFFKESDQIAEIKFNISRFNQKNILLESSRSILKRQNLQNNLESLSSQRFCNSCKKQKHYSYFICLLPHFREYQHQHEFCLCYDCLKQKLKVHIEQHHLNEVLMIQTDTGKPYYYYLTLVGLSKSNQNQKRMLVYDGQSLYQNHASVPYQRGKKYDKKKFFLSQQKLKYIVNNFTSWALMSASNVI